MSHPDHRFHDETVFELIVSPFDVSKSPRIVRYTLAELGTLHPMETLIREAWCQAAEVTDGHEVQAVIDGLPVARFKTDHALFPPSIEL